LALGFKTTETFCKFFKDRVETTSYQGSTHICDVGNLSLRVGPVNRNSVADDDDVAIRNVDGLGALGVPLGELEAATIRLDFISGVCSGQRPVPSLSGAGSEGVPDFIHKCVNLEAVIDALGLILVSECESMSFRLNKHRYLFVEKVALST
jgi:hypothetical protein